MNNLIIIICALMTMGCVKNTQLKYILKDLNATPLCDKNNVLTTAKDTKDSLKAKVIILNYKLDCHVDYTTYQKEKLDRYNKLN